MTENYTSPSVSEIDGALAEIKAIIYEGVELDVARELECNKTWFETGQCPDPIAIGKIEVPSSLLDVLSQEIDFDFMILEQRPDDDGKEYVFVGAREVNDDIEDVPLSAQSSAILRHIADGFNKIMQVDARASSEPDNIKPGSVSVSAGIYQQNDPDIHIDRDTGPLRYVATIIGPSTEFITGTVADTSVFDNEEGGAETSLKLDNPRTPAKKFEVTRFMANANPHTQPVCPEPTFRIFVNGFSYVADS